MDNETEIKKIGRPRMLSDAHRRQVYMTEQDRETLKRLGDGNVSAGIRRILRYAESHLIQSDRKD